LFEARKRYALCVLNCTVTFNHIHLLARDRGNGEIAKGLQLIAGRTAQEFNRRKGRKGAFWEDRYHATAVAEVLRTVSPVREPVWSESLAVGRSRGMEW